MRIQSVGQVLNSDELGDPIGGQLPHGFIGEPFEVETRIENINCMALQDTGSQVNDSVTNILCDTAISLTIVLL